MSADASHSHPAMEWKPKHSPWIVAVSVILPTCLEVLDTTIVSVALNHIAGNLSATYDEATWVLTSYLISNAIVLPASGWLSRYLGRKPFFMTCIGLFTFASYLCGSAHSIHFLILTRVFQGVGGGALQPLSHSILMESFPPHQRGSAMAVFGLGVVFAPTIGPTLGGWITDNFSWPWIFYINLPLGALALFMIHRFVEDPPYIQSAKPGRIDAIGFALLAVWLGTLQIIFDKGQIEDWFESDFIVRLTILSGTAFLLFLWRELSTPEPIVDLRILKNRNFTLCSLLVGAVGITIYGTITAQPMFLQTLLGYNAYNTGIAMSTRGIASMVGMPLCAILIRKFDTRLLIAFGFMMFGLSSHVYHKTVTLNVGMWNIFVPNIVQGLGTSFMFVPITTAAMSQLRQNQLGNAAGIYNLCRNLGGSFGVAMLTTFITRNAQIHQAQMVSHLTPYDLSYRIWLDQAQHNLSRFLGESNSGPAALKALYGVLVQQAYLVAFSQAFHLLSLLSFSLLFLIPILRRTRSGAAPGSH